MPPSPGNPSRGRRPLHPRRLPQLPSRQSRHDQGKESATAAAWPGFECVRRLHIFAQNLREVIDFDTGLLDLQTCFIIAERLDALAEELANDGFSQVRPGTNAIGRATSDGVPLRPRELAMIFGLPWASLGDLLSRLLDEDAPILNLSQIGDILLCPRGQVRRGIYILRQKLARSGFADAISCAYGTGYFVEAATAGELHAYTRSYKRNFILEDRAIRR